jgi:hypothetical protein
VVEIDRREPSAQLLAFLADRSVNGSLWQRPEQPIQNRLAREREQMVRVVKDGQKPASDGADWVS